MSGSSSVVNYNVRTNKSIERNMMCEFIAQMPSIENYRYIGLGAKYFADFILIHKKFNIQDMISLEIKDDEDTVACFEFNKPYDCIDVKHSSVRGLLDDIEFAWNDKQSIVWFDYDGDIRESQIEEVSDCAKKLKSMSLLFASTSLKNYIKKYDKPGDRKVYEARLAQLILAVGKDYTTGFDHRSMARGNICKTVSEIFGRAVDHKINDYNLMVTSVDDELVAKQIALFYYSDSSAMITIGWIIYSKKDEEKVKRLRLERFPFYVSSGNNEFNIDVPLFSYKELAVLNQHMPSAPDVIPEATFLKKEEIEKYEIVYRYYPTTIETGLVL